MVNGFHVFELPQTPADARNSRFYITVFDKFTEELAKGEVNTFHAVWPDYETDPTTESERYYPSIEVARMALGSLRPVLDAHMPGRKFVIAEMRGNDGERAIRSVSADPEEQSYYQAQPAPVRVSPPAEDPLNYPDAGSW